jgi:hypothetical protein
MKRNSLGGLYGRLTPEERFRLDLEATARGDERESQKLVETCPRKTYTAVDYGFSGRWLAAGEITHALCLDLCQHLCRLQMLDALTAGLPPLRVLFVNEAHAAYLDGHEAGSRHAWREAGMEGDPPGWVFRELEDGSVEVDEGREDPRIGEDLDALEERAKEADLAPYCWSAYRGAWPPMPSPSSRDTAVSAWRNSGWSRRRCWLSPSGPS